MVRCSELLEDDAMCPHLNSVLSIPVKAPSNAKFKNMPVLDFLESIKKFYVEWVLIGHVSGINTHNISATVNVRQIEFDDVCKWLWENRN